MPCKKCGNVLSVTAKFCTVCGATVDEMYGSSSAPLNQTPSPYSGNLPATANMPMVPQPMIPPSPPPANAPPMNMMGNDTYFLLINGQQNGPYTVNQMKAMWQTGSINVGTQYWQVGMSGWQPLANIRHFIEVPNAQGNTGNPIVINQVNQNAAYGFAAPPQAFMRSTKSRGVYIVLGLFLGCLGIHNFYAGYAGKGIAQLLITLFLGWFFGLGIFITGLWVLIEIIVVNRDAQGLPM